MQNGIITEPMMMKITWAMRENYKFDVMKGIYADASGEQSLRGSVVNFSRSFVTEIREFLVWFLGVAREPHDRRRD